MAAAEPALIEALQAASPQAPEYAPVPPPAPKSPREDLRAVREAALVGTIDAIARVLAPRFVFLLAAVGGFVLALLARDWLGVAIFAAYCSLIVIPLVVLDFLSKRGRGG